MRVSKYAELPWCRFGGLRGRKPGEDELPEEKRPGGKYKPLFKGTPGEPGNFEMVVLEVPSVGGRYFPRHHHDFDQIRYTIAGNPAWAPGHATPPGSIVYIPAGTWYGPYDREASEETLHLQFEGANGAPFVDYDSLVVAQKELAKKGTFEKGAYSWVDENGKRHNMDGHEAAIEFLTGHKVQFPAPRFLSPVEIHPTSFTWIDVAPGVQIKDLGTFTERRTRLAMISLEGSSSFAVSSPEQRTLLFATAGSGAAGGETIEGKDGVMLELGDEAVISTSSHLELLLIGLPTLASVSTSTSASVGEAVFARS